MALYSAAVTPKQQAMLDKAKAYHNITDPGMPADWAFDSSENLVSRSTGLPVGVAPPGSAPGSSFLGQLLHAAPYIAGAAFMGPAASAIGGGGGTAAALGPSTAANMAATSSIAGGSAVPASLAAGTAAATTAAGAAPSILSRIGGISSKLAPVLSQASGAAEKSNQLRDAQQVNEWGANENYTLNRDKFELTAPGSRLSDSVRASLLSNFTPSKFVWDGPGSGSTPEGRANAHWEGGYEGGLANLDPRTKSLADLLMSDFLAQQQRGGATGGGTDRAVATPPTVGRSSIWDRILGGAATGTSILGALGATNNVGGILSRLRTKPPPMQMSGDQFF